MTASGLKLANADSVAGKEIKNLFSSYYDYVAQRDLLAYSDYVSELAEKESSKLISNGSDEHAQVIIRNLLSHAKTEFCILSSSLKESIYSNNSVIDALTNFLLKKDTKIRIILQDQGIDSIENLRKANKFIDTCLIHTAKKLHAEDEDEQERCVIKKASEKDAEIEEHFAIMDRTGYRFCPNIKGSEAIATFSGAAVATHLREQFEILIDRAQPIPLQI